MTSVDSLIQKDLKHVWHPCTQMKDLEQYPPLVIEKAEGCYLYTNEGPILDAISSWWCKSLGHGHPAVLGAIQQQLTRFEHVMSADTTYPEMAELAEQLAHISGLQHAFFASDGASAVEIAMKLALQAMQLRGQPQRNQFVALQGGYHGETLATLSVSDLGLYKKPFSAFGLPCHFITPLPYVSDRDDPLWTNANDAFSHIKPQLEAIKANTCAILVEPIVQGAGGMRIYSADFLRQLAAFAKENDIYLIADEIMTGLGRTGKWLACHHANVRPDLVCLSKGLTSGSLPLSTVLIDDPIYQLFYDDYGTQKSFLHSHTYSGHPLAVCAALATLKTLQNENIISRAETIGNTLKKHFVAIAEETGKISNIRSIGALVAGDLHNPNHERLGYELQQIARHKGALLRPIGNTLYWLPPLTIDEPTIEKLAKITLHSINAMYA